ncbi:MAG: hypothetical protein ACPG47_06730 [Leucothrix sp.]
MKLKTIKQYINQLTEQHMQAVAIDLMQVANLKTALKDKKVACKHKLRHRVDFAKRERTEKKLKKIKACLKKLELFEQPL